MTYIRYKAFDIFFAYSGQIQIQKDSQIVFTLNESFPHYFNGFGKFINNADYNLKRYCVQADSSYEPEYFGSSRYMKVKCDFKSAVQNLKRSRCC